MGVANNMDISPVNIFIARDHHYNIPYFSQLKNEDIVMIRVIGQRFELNDSAVFIIAELEEQLERGGRDEELVVSKPAVSIENPKEVSGAEEEEQEEEEEEKKEEEEAGPAKSPLSVIAEESQGMMKSLFSSKKSSEEEEEQEQEEEEESSGSQEEQQEKSESTDE
jgi:hypothetical protein